MILLYVAIIGVIILLFETGALGANVDNSKVLQWESLADKYATINSILDPIEILAIIWNESSGNPNATNPGDPSWGLMGVTLPIGEAYAGVTSSSQLLDPETNIKAGSAYLADLKSKLSDGVSNEWIQAYNEGETHYREGKRVPNYQQSFDSHLNQLKGV